MIADDPNRTLHPTPPGQAGTARFPLGRTILHHGLLALGFNIVIALFIAAILHQGKSFRNDIVFSMCIGTLAWVYIDIGRLVLWGQRRLPRVGFALLLVTAAPAAYFSGAILGAMLLGFPLSHVLPSSSTSALASIAFTLTMVLLGGWLFWNRVEMAELRTSAAEQQAHAAAIEKQALQAQLQLLQTQIEPHMLFNTLANLQGLIAIDPARAQTMLDQLIQYLRATLASSRAQVTTLAHEFSLLEAYLGLMSVRMGARLTYALHLPPELRDARMPPMLLQPLIENAIRHGLEPKIGGGRIDVSAECRDRMLTVTVADTGLGMDGDGVALDSPAGTEVGLTNIRDRLRALYGDAARLSLRHNRPSGVIAQLTLPLAP